MDSIERNREIEKIATGPDVLEFWREHGSQWAHEEASESDRARIAAIARSIEGMDDEEAAAIAVPKLQAIWREGLSNADAGFGWDEMNDRLPAAALIAFVRGAA